MWVGSQVFKRLYENTTSNVHVSVHLAILESIRDVCKRVVKELTSWVREKTYSSGLMLVIFSDNLNDLDFECKLEVKYL
jgi:CCR4-NOT transcription complex subunit 1